MMKLFTMPISFIRYVKNIEIINITINKISGSNNLINFHKLKFWNKFITVSFVCLLWLSFISLIATNILQQTVNPLNFANEKSIIIEIYPENTEQKIENKISLVKKILDEENNVISYEILSLEKLKQMIYNFTGKKLDDIENVNIPRIVIAKVESFSDTIIDELRITLEKKVTNIFIDTEKELITRIANPIKAAQYIVIIIPIIALFVLALILFLIVSAVLFSNKETFKILISLGTPFRVIAFEFSQWVFTKTIKASIFCAILNSITIGFCIFSLNVTTIPFMTYLWLFITSIIVIPFFSACLTRIYVYKIINNNF